MKYNKALKEAALIVGALVIPATILVYLIYLRSDVQGAWRFEGLIGDMLSIPMAILIVIVIFALLFRKAVNQVFDNFSQWLKSR